MTFHVDQGAEDDRLSLRLAELKSRFDRSFAESPIERVSQFEDLLSIALGAENHMIRLSQVTGLYLDRSITPLPSVMPDLLGVADFRGELVAVYDLAAVLGYPRAARTRFMLRTRQASVAFAFDYFIGYSRLSKDLVTSQTVSQCGQVHVAGVAQPLIDLAALVAELETRVTGSTSKEA